jgi:plastocyanin
MARFSMTLLALPTLTWARAQYGYGSSSTSAKTTDMAASTPTSTSSSGAVHSISVGQGGQLKFSPDSITAKVGDLVEFKFVDDGHSVALGDFSNPCQPKDSSAFFSGYPVDAVSQACTLNIACNTNSNRAKHSPLP